MASELTPNNAIPTQTQEKYDASSIKVLGDIEAVRKRPAMYIGDTGVRGFHHLLYEVLDNSIDEAIIGECKNIEIKLNKDGSATVKDDGRGIPTDYHKEQKKSALEVVLTMLHAGGKFDKKSYQISGGLHGVGVSVVNALSEYLEVEVYRDGFKFYQKYERGKPICPVEKIGKTTERGTQIKFKPDPDIFKNINFDYDKIIARVRELCYLNRGLTISVEDKRTNRKDSFRFDGGIKEFVEYLNSGMELLHKDIIYIQNKLENVSVEIGMQYNTGYDERIFSYANNIHTVEGGSHLVGFKAALTRTLNSYGKKANIIKNNDISLQGEDYREGLTAIISVLVPEPQFEGQTKTKLGNSEVERIVQQITNDGLSTYLEENPKTAEVIINKAILSAKAREAARKARELTRRKGAFFKGNLPGKLADCISNKVEETELFIVEGESAGGSAKQARDRTFQAILPLKGKILNVEKASLDKMLAHEEIQAIIQAIGIGIDKDNPNMANLRYGKIIIMTDADVDGSHIRTLLLTLFFRYMRELIIQEHLYIAQPPLYRIAKSDKKKVIYSYSDIEMKENIIKMALPDISILVNKKGKEIAGKELIELLKVLEKFSTALKALQKEGISLENVITGRKKLPLYKVEYGNVLKLFSDREQVHDFIYELRKNNPDVIDIWDKEPPLGVDKSKFVMISELTAFRNIEEFSKLLHSYEIEVSELINQDKSEEELTSAQNADKQKFKYTLKLGDEVKQCNLITTAQKAIYAFSQKGIDIQRYKGLGEMNPEQLWETTMDPSRRYLKKATLEDAILADKLFTILMGEQVEPRREFIERNALNVTYLDV